MSNDITFSVVFIGFVLGLTALIFIILGIGEIYYYFKNKKLKKKEEQSKKDFPDYFDKRRKWYEMRNAASEHRATIFKQKEKIKKLTEERKFIPKEDLSNFDYVLEVERHQLKNLNSVWETVYADWVSKRNELWEALEEERKEKNITVFEEM